MIWAALLALFVFCGASAVLLSIQSFSVWQRLGGLLARDGELKILTPELYEILRGAARWTGIGVLVLAAFMLAKPGTASNFLEWLLPLPGSFFVSLKTDFGRLGGAVRWNGRIAAAVTLLTLAILWVRIPFIEMPMRHDEAFSITYFCAAPLKFTLEDYTFPNNHVFHNVLVNLIYHNLGIEPWKVRLPTFLAGLLAVPAAFSLGRRWYGFSAGLLAAVLVGIAPVLIDYGANARGYSLVALFFLLMLRLGTYLKEHKNLAGWLLISLMGALSFFTLPTALFPIGILYLWLFLSMLAGDIGADYRPASFLGCLVISGFVLLAFTLVFYTPLLLRSGWDSLFHNPYVSPLSWPDFWPTLASRLDETWREWNWDVHPLFSFLAMVGCVSSLALHARLTRQRVPAQLAAVGWIVLVLLIQRPNAWSKTWLYLLPLLLIWAAAGLTGLLELIFRKIDRPLWLPIVTVCLAAVLLAGGLLRTARLSPGWRAPTGAVEQAALYLRDILEPTDIVIVAPVEDAPMWYYAELYGFHDQLTRSRLFFRAYALVNPQEAQTLESVMQARGPDSIFLDFDSARIVGQFGEIDLYAVDALRDRVIEAYGETPEP